MRRNIKSFIDQSLHATDGEIGKIRDCFFDDETWTLRYLVVKTGSWLFGREVLISPEVIVNGPQMKGTIPVNLLKEQIRTSPDIDTKKTVSRQQEIELYAHYQWQPYWGAGFYAGGGVLNMNNAYPVAAEPNVTDADKSDKPANENKHLRSTHAITGYHVQASDGEMGHVADFIIDEHNWQLLSFVIDTRTWFSGNKLLIPVEHIKEIQWENSKIVIDMSVEAVNNCTIYEESGFHPDMQPILQP